jgi:type II secretory pathway pseudopilin PulG
MKPENTTTVYRTRRSSLTAAFTLVELLGVSAIIGILAAMTIAGVGKVRSKARAVQCQSNLRQIYLAFNLFALDHKNRWPSRIAATFDADGNVNKVEGNFVWFLMDYIPAANP